ncbi:MAG TPA: FtsX-like permease family protein [Candidatus Binataceae bacterium]|nr:FtsX-like permease family protein [Candidatus Binataceae bacterium]
MGYELTIALRYLRARRKDAFISVTTVFTAVGVMLGVAALVIVLAVMGGFEASLRQRILSLTPQVEIQSLGGTIDNYAAIESRADGVPGVAGSDPFVVGQGMVSSAGGISGVIVRGVEPAKASVIAQLRNYVQQGSLGALNPSAGPPNAYAASNNSHGALAIGSTLADQLKVKTGDAVNLVAPIMGGKDAHLTTTTGRFTIGAVFESGIAFVDRDLVFMNLTSAQSFFGRDGRVDGIEVLLTNLDQTDQVTAQLRAMLGKSFRVANWREFDQAAAAGFEMLKRVYALVLLMLIGVAAFNLVATLIMVVMEKRKDIAVLMSMGATAGDVRRIFLLKGMIVGAAGTAAGLAIGALGCFLLAHYHFIHIEKKIYGISTLPVDAQPLNFAIVAVASMMLCWIAAVYPARQAAREMPVEVFRS